MAAAIGNVGRRALLLSALSPAVPPMEYSSGTRSNIPGTSSNILPSLTLSDGSTLPSACFGIQIYDDATATECTLRALEAGFRCFFTSPEAGNQYGFARAIRESGVPRNELCILGSVLSDDAVGFRAARTTTKDRTARSLETLASGGVDALDMLLLERPGFECESIRGQWRALEDAQASGIAKRLGTCNFDVEQLDCLLAKARTRPLLNQIQYTLAIRMPHEQIRAQHEARGVRLMAFSPLGGPGAIIPISTIDECKRFGKRRGGATAYQVPLRWLTQQGVAYSVHSRSLAHLREDLSAAGGVALSEAEMRTLTDMSERAPAYY